MRIVIIGARPDGQGKVVLEILRAMEQYEILGFVDDCPDPARLGMPGFPVIGSSKDLRRLKEKAGLDGAIIAMAANRTRRELASEVEEAGLQLVNAVHPTVHLDSDVRLGRGNVLCPGVIIVAGTRVGRCVNIHTGATVDHDNLIEDGANLGPGVHTAGRVKIGRDAFVGAGAVFIPDMEVGEGAVVGAGAVVIRPVQPYQRVVGVPARPIRNKQSND